MSDAVMIAFAAALPPTLMALAALVVSIKTDRTVRGTAATTARTDATVNRTEARVTETDRKVDEVSMAIPRIPTGTTNPPPFGLPR